MPVVVVTPSTIPGTGGASSSYFDVAVTTVTKTGFYIRKNDSVTAQLYQWIAIATE